ncbi:MAG TPA: DUF2917 domain-containing protein [Casimicrobiaceae bacterium]|nr:DUF2917 domain-containing protein [Casimicrobiaceae bacterium]
MNKRLLTLDDGDLLKLEDARGTTLRVHSGGVWLTQDGDQRDIMLSAGDAWTIERPGVTLAMARGATTLRVGEASANDAEFRMAMERWANRITAWMGRSLDRYVQRGWVPHV